MATIRKVVSRTYRGALPTLLVSAAGGLLAGVVLGGMEDQLARVPGLLVVVPAFLAIRGSVYGSLGARLSSALHQGLIEPRFEADDRLIAAIAAALANGLIASAFAAVAAFVALGSLGRPVAPLSTLVFVALLGGALAGIALALTVLVAVFVGYRRGLNPDDVVGPTVTTAGDVFGMSSLFVATGVVLAV